MGAVLPYPRVRYFDDASLDRALVFCGACVAYLLTLAPQTTANEHVLQAWAMLRGHLYVEQPVWEHVVANGHSYLLHPPLAALVCLPFVAIWGLATNQTAISAFISALNVLLAWRLLETMEVERVMRWWLTTFFAFGTIAWYEGTLGAAWGLTLTLSMAPTLLALDEVFGARRPWLIGLWAGVAALARYDLALVIPLYALVVGPKRAGGVLLLSLPALAFYLWWSHERFGGWNDEALWRWYQVDSFGQARNPHTGPFSLNYLAGNLYTALFMAPKLTQGFPWVRPHAIGQAIVLTSPAFLLTLKASFTDKMTWWLWAAVILAMGASMTVYSNGWVQFGHRYSIQAYPFLFALMALGSKDRLDQLGKALIVFSIILVGSGLATIRLYGFA